MATRIVLPARSSLTLETVLELWKKQEEYIDGLESSVKDKENELSTFRRDVAQLRRQESAVMARYLLKEGEYRELQRAHDYAMAVVRRTQQVDELRRTSLEPATNLLISRLRREVLTLREQLEQHQHVSATHKFTADSALGQRLIAKCQKLQKENEDLGAELSSGRVARLEGECAVYKNIVQSYKLIDQSREKMISELDEELETFQLNVSLLQNRIRLLQEQVSGLEGERQALRLELERSGVSSECVDTVLAHVRSQAPDAARSEKLYVPGADKPVPVAISSSSADASSAAPASASVSTPSSSAPTPKKAKTSSTREKAATTTGTRTKKRTAAQANAGEAVPPTASTIHELKSDPTREEPLETMHTST